MKPATLRKLSAHGARLSLFVFLAVVVAGFFLPISYAVTWVPLALWLVLTLLGNNRMLHSGPADARAGAAAAVEVEAPVAGRWRALNSPADKVPSHGTRAYGQEYAIDVVAEPEPGARPVGGWWLPARRNEAFPAFGRPLHAVADGTVVRADDRQRDHRSRSGWPAVLYLLVVESVVRSLAGARRVIGNHVILDLGDGTYALYAHVRRGSLTVREGDRVRAGQQLGECGNTGNSTEPHVHFQLMDDPDPDAARGVPFTWRGVGVPGGNELFEAGPAPEPAVP